MSIENLILFDSSAEGSPEYDPETFKQGIASLKEKLDAEIPNEDIRKALISLKDSLHKHPQIVHELLPEDIGQMTRAIKLLSNVVLVKDQAKQTKKKSKTISRAELARMINKDMPEDF